MVHTATFTPPPSLASSSLTLAELYDFHANNSPQYPLFTYSVEGVRQAINFRRVGEGIHRAARRLLSEIVASSIVRPPVVGVLAVTDSITSATILLGFIRSGIIPLIISPRNSEMAIQHLLGKMEVTALYCSHDQPTRDKAANAVAMLPSPVDIYELPGYDDLYNDTKVDHVPQSLSTRLEETCVILHSSGTTAFPKLVPLSHSAILAFANAKYHGAIGMPNQVEAIHGVPMFHTMGISSIVRVVTVPTTLAVFPPASPPHFPHPSTIIQAVSDDKCTVMVSVPTLIEQWANEPGSVEVLARLSSLVATGGPLATSVGDALVKQGVSLSVAYGATEIGTMSTVVSPTAGTDDWAYFPFSEQVEVHLRPQADSSMHEVFVVRPQHPTQRAPSSYDTTVEGAKAWNTHDLVEKHSTRPGLWRVVGRSDDQIMLSTGEKTNPGPLERMFLKDTRIQSAVMFGRGRPYNGILIQLNPHEQLDVADRDQLNMFRESLIPTLEAVNAYSPSHSRLYKEMVIVAHRDKPFELNFKGSPRRAVVLEAYESEINETYEEFQNCGTLDMQQWVSPLPWSEAHCRGVISDVLRQCIGRDIPFEDDIFHHGCDSLLVQRISGLVSSCLTQSASMSGTNELPKIQNTFVYRHPTPCSMVQAIQKMASGSAIMSLLEREIEMKAILSTLLHNSPEATPTSSAPPRLGIPLGQGECVLLTGTTGALGSAFLAQLVANATVARVYAFNRKSTRPLLERQMQAYRDYRIDCSRDEFSKVILLEGDMNKVSWGLELQQFEEIQRDLTLVIHNAWPVSFNYTLSSFLPVLQGVKRLAEFATREARLRPRVVFISTVAVSGGSLEPSRTDAPPKTGLGYAESKWMAECIFESFFRSEPQAGLLSIIRVGQVCGGENGAWNVKEWFPALVQAASVLRCLPLLPPNMAVSWVPVHAVTSAIVSHAMQTQTRPPISGGVCAMVKVIRHPSPISWQTLASLLIAELGNDVSLVAFNLWLDRLQAYSIDECDTNGANGTSKRRLHAATTLFEFFRTYGVAITAEGDDGDSSGNMKDVGLLIKDLPPLGEEEVRSWLAYWKDVGLL